MIRYKMSIEIRAEEEISAKEIKARVQAELEGFKGGLSLEDSHRRIKFKVKSIVKENSHVDY